MRAPALKPLTLAIMVGLVGFAPVAWGQSENSSQESGEPGEEFEQAALDFVAWCGPCHGRTGEGNGPVAGSLKAAPPDLTKIAIRNGGTFPAEAIRLRIDGRELPAAHGTQEMPVWGYWFNLEATAAGLLQEDRVVAEKEVAERVGRLVDYIATLQKE